MAGFGLRGKVGQSRNGDWDATDLELPAKDRSAQGRRFAHRRRTEFRVQRLFAARVLRQRRRTVPQAAVRSHRSPVRVLAQRILLQQSERHGQRGLVLAERLTRGHQLRQGFAIHAFQPVALVQHPVIVETVKEGAAIEVDGAASVGGQPRREEEQLLELGDVESAGAVGIERDRGDARVDEVAGGQAAANLPRGPWRANDGRCDPGDAQKRPASWSRV